MEIEEEKRSKVGKFVPDRSVFECHGFACMILVLHLYLIHRIYI